MSVMLARVERMSIPARIAKDLRTLALQGMPYEVCGLVYQHNIIVQYPNISCGDKKHSFDMEADVADAKAMWHSHPTGPDMPTKDDMSCIEMLEKMGIHIGHIIVTPSTVHEYEALVID